MRGESVVESGIFVGWGWQANCFHFASLGAERDRDGDIKTERVLSFGHWEWTPRSQLYADIQKLIGDTSPAKEVELIITVEYREEPTRRIRGYGGDVYRLYTVIINGKSYENVPQAQDTSATL